MLRLTLAFSWGLTIFFFPAKSPAEGLRGKSGAPTVGEWPTQVRGYGLTVEDAQQDAIRELKGIVTGFLEKHVGPRLWQPSEEFVRSELLATSGWQGEDADIPSLGKAKTWIYPVKALDLRKIEVLEEATHRQGRAQQRQVFANFVLGGVTIVLALVTAILWLRSRKHSTAAR